MSVGGGVLGATSPEVSSGDGGSGDWVHIYGRVEAMLPRVEALAADRTQRESSLHVRLLHQVGRIPCSILCLLRATGLGI